MPNSPSWRRLTEVPFLDLRAAYDELAPEIEFAVHRAVSSGWYIGGPEVEAFESAFADYCGANHCVGVANGLDALHLSLRALEIGAGDEVILASNSYIATVLAVTMAGATPVFVEPDPATYNLDPARISEAVTSRTKGILPTHLYGQPADIDEIHAIAREHDLRVIEDAAQAHGARYKGRRLGAHSDVICWSFYPTKNLGAFGDAGAITTNDSAIARQIRTLGNYGTASKRYVSEVRGVNSRLDPVQAAVLGVKLKHLDAWNRRRAEAAAFYRSHLPSGLVELPHVPDWAEPAWHLFVIRHPAREKLIARLLERGVQTLVHYPVPPHRQPAYASLQDVRLPLTERLHEEVLSLPLGPTLCDADADRVIAACQTFACPA